MSATPRRVGPLSSRLLLLELRRTVGGGLTPLCLALTLVVLYFHPGGLPGVEREAIAVAERGMTRETAWTAALVVLIPALVFRAGATLSRWRAGEWSWLGSRAAGPTTAIASTWVGSLLGAGALLFAVGALIEWRVAEEAPSWLFVGEYGSGEVLRLEPGEELSARLPGLPARSDARLRARVAVGPGGGPTTVAELEVRGPETRARTTEGHVEARTWVEVPVPAGTDELELTLRNRGDGVLVWLAAGGQLFEPVRSESCGSLSVALLATAAVAALMALALGLGAWMSPATAGLTALVPWWVALVEGGATRWLPGGGLLEALSLLAEGRCAPAAAPAALVALGLSLLAGGALARWGLHSQGAAG